MAAILLSELKVFISNSVIGYRGTSKDITERRNYEERIERMAQYDNLTGLPNRALFYDRLQLAIALPT